MAVNVFAVNFSLLTFPSHFPSLYVYSNSAKQTYYTVRTNTVPPYVVSSTRPPPPFRGLGGRWVCDPDTLLQAGCVVYVLGPDADALVQINDGMRTSA